MEVRIFTLWQPRATLMALGLKTIETRSRGTSYRGPIAIHAALRYPETARVFAGKLMHEGVLPMAKLPFGKILCVVDLYDVRPTEEGSLLARGKGEHRYGNYDAGRSAWLTKMLKSLDNPVPYPGAQGLRRLPEAFVQANFPFLEAA